MSPPALGLIVLRVDETIEQDFRRLFAPDDARVHITRIQSGDDLTPDSIAAMKDRLTEAASLLPAAADFDVVGYACTSGTALIGVDEVASRVSAGVATRAVTTPLTAATARIKDLGLSRVGIVSPYVSTVAEGLTRAFETLGVAVGASVSLNEKTEAKVARIAPEVTANAARDLARQGDVDGVFLSCTNLQTLPILGPLSQELGVPVLSSNAALAWHMRQLAGLEDRSSHPRV